MPKENISTPLLQDNANFLAKYSSWLSFRSILSVAPTHPFSMLDIGCGWDAKLLFLFRHRLTNGVGMDSKVKESVKHDKICTFIEGDLHETLPKLSGIFFDFITAVNIIEHIEDPHCILQKLRYLLKPNGVLFIMVPTWFGKMILESLYFHKWNSDKNAFESINEHKMYYWKKDLWPILVRAGFKPSNIKMRYTKAYSSTIAVIQNKPT